MGISGFVTITPKFKIFFTENNDKFTIFVYFDLFSSLIEDNKKAKVMWIKDIKDHPRLFGVSSSPSPSPLYPPEAE